MSKGLALISVFLLTTVNASGQATSEVSQAEAEARKQFQLEEKMLAERYKDFYQRSDQKRLRRQQRWQGAKDQTKERERLKREQEERRKAYAASRRAKKPDLAAEKAHLKKIEEQKRLHRIQRNKYLKNRNVLRKQRETVKKIPQDQDVGLSKDEVSF